MVSYPLLHALTNLAGASSPMSLHMTSTICVCNTAGKTEKKEHLLAESDDMWVALRHKHFAAATIEITRTLDEFRAKNKAAAYKQGNGGDGALDMRNMRSLVSSLPQYR